MSALDIANCQEHEDAIEVADPSEPMGCEDCGKLIWTVKCPHCNETFIDYRQEGSDDVMSSAYFSEQGSMLCQGCMKRYQTAEMELEFEGDYIPDDYAD